MRVSAAVKLEVNNYRVRSRSRFESFVLDVDLGRDSTEE